MTSTRAFLSLAALLVIYLFPLVLGGEVIYPHDNKVEMGVLDAQDEEPGGEFPQATWNPLAALERTPISNRKFSDQSSVYVPELHHHMHGDAHGWLSTWNPHVELGRPTMQISGLSRAFLITRAVMWFTSDALRVYTVLTALTIALTALFTFLFLRALDLHPWACFAAAAGISMGVFASFWLTFVMYVSGLCWTLALLWLVTIFIRRATLPRGIAIAFAIHALCMTGYPQQLVWHAYLLVAYTACELAKRHGWGLGLARSAAVIALWVAVGVATVLPVYLDLAVQVARTGRLESGPEVFFSRLPPLNSLGQWSEYLSRLFDAFWLGNPIDPRYTKFDGVTLTPLYCGLLLLACLPELARRAALWLAFVAVGFLMTVWPPAYLFGIEHLGLNLSRFVPIAAIVIPAAVAGAIALDHALRCGFSKPVRAALLASLPALFALGVSPFSRYPLHAGFLLTSLSIAALFAAFVARRKTSWLVLLVLVSVFHYGRRLILSRPEADIQLSSPLVADLRARTPDGSRYASVISSERELLPPNQECRLGLASIHSFDPLIPSAYKEWVLRVSETGTRAFGKQFRGMTSTSKIESDEFGYAGVGVVVSAKDLGDPRIREVADVDGTHVYEPPEKPVMFAQLDAFEMQDVGAVTLTGPLRVQQKLSMEMRAARDDRREYAVTSATRPTLLWLSQQFHPQWQARSNSATLDTVVVNGFYQGVILPPGTSAVELEFRPWARWSFVPQWLFAGAAIACAIGWLARRTPRSHST